jgi:hypothetical protein
MHAWGASGLSRYHHVVNHQRLLYLAAMLASMGAAVSAHHSDAAYETRSIVLKSATMTGVVWANPHTLLTFTVKDTSGGVTTWTAESGSPSALTRMGWNRNSVKAGDAATIELFPARNGSKVGRLAKVILPDGRELLDSLSTASRVIPVP